MRATNRAQTGNKPKKGQVSFLRFLSLAAVTVAAGALGCSSTSNAPAGGGGSGGPGGQGGLGGQTGTAGVGGKAGTAGVGGKAGTAGVGGKAGAAGGVGGGKSDGGADRSDAASAFKGFDPCASESSYVSNTTQIAFGGALGLNYSPACLKVAAGATITFSGDFATHPLTPSISRTTVTSNPIVSTESGTTKSFTFVTPGFYGYFCLQHGTDEGVAMAGMIWVQ
jgi:plastocyanin